MRSSSVALRQKPIRYVRMRPAHPETLVFPETVTVPFDHDNAKTVAQILGAFVNFVGNRYCHDQMSVYSLMTTFRCDQASSGVPDDGRTPDELLTSPDFLKWLQVPIQFVVCEKACILNVTAFNRKYGVGAAQSIVERLHQQCNKIDPLRIADTRRLPPARNLSRYFAWQSFYLTVPTSVGGAIVAIFEALGVIEVGAVALPLALAGFATTMFAGAVVMRRS